MYTAIGVGEGVEGALAPPCILNLIFSYYIFSKKGCLLSFEWKKCNFTIFAHPPKILGFTWKILLLPPPGTQRLINHGQLVNHSALIRSASIFGDLR